jgi:signal transduction histidine kinase
LTELLEQRKALHRRVKEIEEKCQTLEDAVTHMQPLANLGLAWAMTAHELNNLLVPLMNYAQLALQHPEDAALCEKAIQKAARLSERASGVLEKVILLANGSGTQKDKHVLNHLLDNVFDCIGRDFKKDRIRVVRQVEDDVILTADGVALQQVLMNLILNARHAMLECGGGVLTISAEQTADGTRIHIADTGCGIEPDRLKAIFTPFYTAGKDGGNGLGLAFCRKVIEAHDGFITVDSEPDKGTRFKILLPKYTL